MKFKKEQELQVLAIENHKFCFNITQILSVILDFFNKTWDYV